MPNRSKYAGSPLDLPDGLFLCFLLLKLSSHIDWSWWWIISPLLFQFILIALIRILDDD